MIEDFHYICESINEQDRKILESMRYPNSYAMMTHLDDDVVESLLAQVGLTKDQLNQPGGTVSALPFKQLLDINIARHDSPVPYSFDVTREFNISSHGKRESTMQFFISHPVFVSCPFISLPRGAEFYKTSAAERSVKLKQTSLWMSLMEYLGLT